MCCGVAVGCDEPGSGRLGGEMAAAVWTDGVDGAQRMAAKFIPDDTLIYRATEIFAALADSTRFKILSALANGELCVHELVAVCDVSQSAVSHQLRLLKDRSLVNSRREGKKVVYSFADDHVRSLILIGLEHAAEAEELR
jgi:ArsR family transcriptional regulator